jgi:hypothetical protein
MALDLAPTKRHLDFAWVDTDALRWATYFGVGALVAEVEALRAAGAQLLASADRPWISKPDKEAARLEMQRVLP